MCLQDQKYNGSTVEGFVKLPGIFRPSLTQLNFLDHKKLRGPVITLSLTLSLQLTSPEVLYSGCCSVDVTCVLTPCCQVVMVGKGGSRHLLRA